ncbi:MAG: hypothetical protein NZM11_12610, partial [Anaerolineales bacterium]|nr:hypothetical protein [Anaerolineales bacterium]
MPVSNNPHLEDNMKSKAILSAGLVLVVLLSACAPTGTPTPQAGGPLQSIGPGEGKVSIVAWPGYIERGATDPRFDWVTQFEKDTGCMVEVKTAN